MFKMYTDPLLEATTRDDDVWAAELAFEVAAVDVEAGTPTKQIFMIIT